MKNLMLFDFHFLRAKGKMFWDQSQFKKELLRTPFLPGPWTLLTTLKHILNFYETWCLFLEDLIMLLAYLCMYVHLLVHSLKVLTCDSF